ncbi:MAG: EAL domain-containing protein [Nostoc sp. CmiVER01]|uniref:EAL domain-containing protein n=1 Tax=Nostoc sp. CmiVER01 TaxID=3075384 RepID=UPI002AD5AAFB|nr:EAL domain-containing protein [Nostoc sp. CmiVER01]MDZ8127068.1 EAL domain-containing protein [Nostoc sp. CmiVER01]
MTSKDPVASPVNGLVLSEEAFFFERSLDLLSVVGLDGYFKRINPAFTQTLGYSEAELLASPFLDFVHPDDHFATLAEMEKVKTGIPTLNFENRYRTKDGRYRWLGWTASPQIARGVIYCVAREMTQQKEVEAALQRANQELEQRVAERTAQLEQANAVLAEREALYRTLTQHIPNGAVHLFDHELRFLLIEGSEIKQLGLDGAALVGQTIWEVLPPETCEQIEPMYRAALIGQISVQEVLYSNQVYEVHTLPVRSEQGEIFAGMVLTQNMTHRKQAEAELQESRATLQRQLAEIESIYQSVPIGLSVLDTNLRFVRINQRLAEINGFSVEEHIGRTIRELLPNIADTAEELLRPILETGEPLLNVEIRGKTPAQPGVERVWLESFLPLKDGEQIIGINTVCQEITEQIQVDEALRQSEERFRTMADNAPVMVRVTDATGYCTYLSQSWYEFTGQTEATGLGFGWLNAVHPEDFAFARETFISANIHHKAFRAEYRLRRHDEEYSWAIDAASPWFEADGQYKGYIGSVIDITDRKQAEEALRRSEERYRMLFETMEDGFCVIEMLFDANNTPIDYRFLEINPAFEQQTGLQQAEGKTLRQLIPNMEEFWFKTYGKVALTGEPIRFENGSEALNRWFDVYAFRIEQPERRKVAILFKDISDRKQSEIALRENEDRLRMAIASAQLGTWDWNLVTGELKWDIGCKAMFGLPPDAESSIEAFFEGLHPDDCDRLQQIIQEALNPASGGSYDTEYRTIGIQDKVERWLRAKGQAYFDENGKPIRFIGTVLNITEQKQTEAQLIYDVFHDSLTGLPNRALFVERLEQALVRTKRHSDYRFAVLFLDVDRFKVINDSLGHMIGDQLLTALARRLQMCVRVGDTVARLGGDEFTILLDDIKDLNDVKNVATRINVALTKAFNLAENEVITTVSIGIALSTNTYNLPEELIRDADIAMYRAKAQGKARYEIFDFSMYSQAAQLLQLEMDLRRAIERQEFQVYYQPIVSLETYKIIGFEALVRWQHREHGIISPERFIPLAEETGLIVPIGYWVLREACRQMQAWQLKFPTNPILTISVNISSKQFCHPNLIEEIRQILLDSGLEGSSLKLEITESVLMENSDSATAMLLELQQMDIQLHLDDFGTGYSSLSYLHHFPFSALKIDRSFVINIGANGRKLDIVQAIISLAESLNIDVIAEGIETREQLTQLQNKKCKHAQGYIFSRPLDSNSVDTLIASSLYFQLN